MSSLYVEFMPLMIASMLAVAVGGIPSRSVAMNPMEGIILSMQLFSIMMPRLALIGSFLPLGS